MISDYINSQHDSDEEGFGGYESNYDERIDDLFERS